MRLGTVTQQPTERLSYTITYEDALTDGDNVHTAMATVSPVGLVVDNVGVFDPRVKFWVTGGESGVSYQVTLTVYTDDGRIFQDEVVVKVREI